MAQFGIQNKHLVNLFILFVLFFVLTSPDVAGPQARAFFGWLGDLASSLGVFLEGLFSADEAGG